MGMQRCVAVPLLVATAVVLAWSGTASAHQHAVDSLLNGRLITFGAHHRPSSSHETARRLLGARGPGRGGADADSVARVAAAALAQEAAGQSDPEGRSIKFSGAIPPELVEAYAKEAQQGGDKAPAAGVPDPPSPPPPRPAPPSCEGLFYQHCHDGHCHYHRSDEPHPPVDPAPCPGRSPPPPVLLSPGPASLSPPPPPGFRPSPSPPSPSPASSPPPPSNPPQSPQPPPQPQFTPWQYGQVLAESYMFYEAQRSGVLPRNNRIKWRWSAHTDDIVPGGWYDAGDYIKHSMTIAQSATFIAWAVVDFEPGHRTALQLATARASVKWAADYLRACRLTNNSFLGLVGNPDIDHNFWGRAHEQTGLRPNYIWNATMAASDLLGTASAALASASMALLPVNSTDALDLLKHAQELYNLGTAVQGLYSQSMSEYPWVYSSSRFHDKLMLAASWLYRATGNTRYLDTAHQHWQDAGGVYGGSVNPYVSWDSLYAPAVVNLLGVAARIGSSNVPGHSEYSTYFEDFARIWIGATGSWGIVKTPNGLRYATWSQWGNLRYAANTAFTLLLRAKQLPEGNAERSACLEFAKSQIDYALGSTGRSFVVGWGINPPQRVHHAGASCPNPPATCDWAQFGSPLPNPQVLRGALVAGPAGPGDDTYFDNRDDYVTNEVAIDYNAGFTGALAGLVQLRL